MRSKEKRTGPLVNSRLPRIPCYCLLIDDRSDVTNRPVASALRPTRNQSCADPERTVRGRRKIKGDYCIQKK